MKHTLILICIILYTSCKTPNEVITENKKPPSIEMSLDTLQKEQENYPSAKNEIQLNDSLFARIEEDRTEIVSIITEYTPIKTTSKMKDIFDFILKILDNSFFLFVAGLVYYWYREKMSKINETIDFRNIIFSWIEKYLTPINEQYQRIVELAEKVETSNDINPERFAYPALTINRINNIPIEKYISIFVLNSIDIEKNDKLRNDTVYSFVSSLEFIVRVESAIKEQYEEYREAYHNILKGTNTIYLEFLDIIKEMDLKRNQLSENESQLLIISLQSITDYVTLLNQDNGSNAKKIIYDNLVTPINDALRNIPAESRSFYIDKIGKCMSDYIGFKRQWDATQSGYSTNFKGYAYKYQRAYNKINSSIEFFKQTKVKNIFQIN